MSTYIYEGYIYLCVTKGESGFRPRTDFFKILHTGRASHASPKYENKNFEKIMILEIQC